MLQVIKDLPHTVWQIGLISLLNDTASDLIYPLIPLHLTSVLMAVGSSGKVVSHSQV